MNSRTCATAILLALVSILVASVQAAEKPANNTNTGASAATQLQLFPLAFERNEGQADGRAEFLAHGNGYSVLLAPSETVLSVGNGANSDAITLQFANGSRTVRMRAEDMLPTRINYLIGNDRSRWRTNIPTYGRVKYSSIYPGIDVVFYGNQGQIEHDFIVAPHANANKISFLVSGTRSIDIDAAGNLVLHARNGDMRFLRPTAYQVIHGVRRPVQSRFRLLSGNRVRFQVGNYDRRSELVIDPVLNWNTYLYGLSSNSTAAKAIAVDSTNGRVFVAGDTTAASFGSATATTCATCGPASSSKAFIARIDKLDGSSNAVSGSSLKWLTFLGGSGSEKVNAAAIDATYVFVGGQTTSTSTGGGNGDFPVSANTFETTGTVKNATSSGFVAAIDQANGSTLKYGSYVGENSASGNGSVTSLVVHGGTDLDNGADIYAAGWTDNGGGKLANNSNGYQSSIKGDVAGFVVQLDTTKNGTGNFGSGELVYGSYIQASNAGGGDSLIVNGLAVDNAAYPDWVKQTNYNSGDLIIPTTNNSGGYVYQASKAGTSLSNRPSFDQTPGNTTGDGTGGSAFNWINVGKAHGRIYLAGSATGLLPPKLDSCPNGTAITGTAGFVLRLDVSLGECGALSAASTGYDVELGGGASTTTSANALVIDGNSPVNAYVTGATNSSASTLHTGTVTGLASTAPGDTGCTGCGDAFVARVSTTAGAAGVDWSAYIGGDKVDSGNAISVDTNNNVAIVGSTSSSQGGTNVFPLANAPATSPFNTLTGNQSAFVSIIGAANTNSPSLLFSSYYGGSQIDRGNALALLQNVSTPSPAAVIAYVAGTTTSQDLPVNAVAAQSGPVSAFGTGTTVAIDTAANSGLTVASNVATVKTTSAHGFSVGQIVTTAGSTDTTFNGTCQISSVPDTTHFSCPFVHANGTTGTGTVGASNTGAFAGQLSFVNATASMSLAGVSDVPTIGFNTAAGFASTVKYTYTLTLNSGTINDATFDASIPKIAGSPAFNVTSAVPDTGTCQVVAAKGVTCQLGTPATGTKVVINATATSAAECNTASACTSLPVSFVATLAAAEKSTIATGTVSTPAIPATNLAVSDVGPGSATVGGAANSVTYTVTVTNTGANDAPANSLSVADTLPGNFIVDTAPTATNWTCTSGTGSYTCVNTGAALVATTGTATFLIKGHYDINANLGGSGSATETNKALLTVDASKVLDTTANVSVDAATTVTRSASLSLNTATNAPLVSLVPTVNLNDSFTYTFTVASASGATVTNATLTTNLPAGFAVTSAVANVTAGAPVVTGCLANGTSCTGITLAAGDSFDYVVTGSYPESDTTNNLFSGASTTKPFTTAPALLADVTPAATVGTTPTVAVDRSAILTLTAPGLATANIADTSASYTFTITSDAASKNTATGMVLTPNLPPGFVVSSITPTFSPLLSGNATSCTLTAVAGGPGCSAATLKPNSSLQLVFHGSFSNTTISDNTLTHEVKTAASAPTLSADIVNPGTTITNPDPTTGKLSTDVQRSSTLTLTVASSPNPVNLGVGMTYVVTLTNTAGATATNIRMPVTLPGDFTVSSVSSITGVSASLCDATTTATGCTGAAVGDSGISLAVGSAIVYTVSGSYADSATGGVLSSTLASDTRQANASVTAAIVDTLPACNGTTCPATTIQRTANLSLIEQAAPATATLDDTTAGTNVTYSLRVANPSGPNTATNVVVTANLPTKFVPATISFTNVSGSPVTTSCTLTAVGGAPGCSGATLPSGATFDMNIVGKYPDDGTVVADTAKTSVQTNVAKPTLTASVLGTHTLPSAFFSTTVQRVATLTLGTSTTAATVNLDGTISYTLTLANTAGNKATTVSLLTAGANTTPKGILPAGFVATAVTPTLSGGATGTCDATTAATGCTGLTIPVGGSVVYKIDGSFPAAGTALDAVTKSAATTLTSSVTAAVNNAIPTDQTTGSSVTVQRKATLTLTVTGSATPVALGTSMDYTIVLSSSSDPLLSPNTATNVRLNAVVPAEFHVTSVTATPTSAVIPSGKCDTSTTAAGCSFSLAAGTDSGITIAPGGNITYKITGSYPDKDFTVLNATTTSMTRHVSSDSAASANPLAPTAVASTPDTTVQRTADLNLSSITDTSTVKPVPLTGSLLLSSSIADVNGPDDATNVTVAYTMATGGYSINAGQTTYPGGCTKTTSTLITCSLATPNKVLAANTGASFVLALTPDAAVLTPNPGTPANSANVSASGTIAGAVVDPGPSVNTNNVVTSVQRQSDLALATVTDNGPVALNGSVTYQIPVKNFGPDPAPGTVVTLTLPTTGYTISGATADTFPGHCTEAVVGSNKVVTCNVDSPTTPGTTCVNGGGVLTTGCGTLVSNPTYAVTVKLDPALTISSGNNTTFDTGIAISSAYAFDADNKGGTVNSLTKTTTVSRQADLSIAVTDISPVNPVPLGGPLKYSVVVTNNGPNDAQSILVTFTMPTSGYKLLSDTFNTACTPAAGTPSATFTCGVANLTNGLSSSAYTISLAPDPAAILSGNKATIHPASIVVSSTDISDPQSNNNDGFTGSNLQTVIARKADLRIASPSDNSSPTNPVSMKGPLTYSTSVLNANSAGFGDDANNVVVTYSVPSGYVLVPNGWTGYNGCSQAGVTVTCTIAGTISANTTAGPFTVSVTPGTSAVAANAKTATVSTPEAVSSATVYDDGSSGAANPLNNNASQGSTIARRADLQITSFADHGAVGDAGPLKLTVQLANTGPDDGGPVQVLYTLPSGSSVISTTYSPACTGPSGNVLTCSVAGLAAGGTASFDIDLDPQDLSAGGSTSPVTGAQVLSNFVWDDTLNTGAPGPNNSASVTSTIKSVVHLNVASIVSNPPVSTPANLGQTVKYTIVVNNATTTSATFGSAITSPATDVTVSVSLPPDYAATASIDPSSPVGWSCNFAVVPASCTYNNNAAPITSGGNVSLVITGNYPDSTTITSGGGTAIVGVSAVVASTTSVNQDGFTTQSDSTQVRRYVAISASATSNPPLGTPAVLETDVLYTIVVSNAATVSTVATNSAVGVFLDVTLPINFIGATVDGTSSPGWGCGTFVPNGAAVRCMQGIPIAPGGSTTLVIRGHYSDSTTGPNATVLSNGQGGAAVLAAPGSLSSSQASSVPLAPANAATTLERLVHLTATAASTPAVGTFAILETPVTYTFQVGNATTANSVATNTATGVLLNVALPANFITPTVTSSNWDCGTFAVNPQPCTFNGTIAPGGTAANALVITGKYSNATSVLPGGGSYPPGTGNVSVTAGMGSTLSFDPTPGSVSTSTDIQRNVQLTLTQTPPSVDPVALGSPVSYTFQASNSLGFNDAKGITVTETLPSGFNYTSFSGTGWSCGAAVSGVVSCTYPLIAAGGSSTNLVFTGSYDPTISLSGSGTGVRTNSGSISSTLSFDTLGTAKSASVNSTIQRLVDLGVSIAVAPSPIGAGGAASNVATYTITVSDSGANDVSGSANSVRVDFPIPLGTNFTNITASGTGSTAVTCDTTGTPGHVICTYAKQTTSVPTVITIKGQFATGAVDSTGSATASTTVTVSTADGIDATSANNTANTSIIVVDTPTGSNVTPILTSTGHPITVTYPSVTTAGITTQGEQAAPPVGFVQPSATFPSIDYSASPTLYFLIASDSTAPVVYTTPVSVCVAYKSLVGITFAKPERVRIFDQTGKDITTSLDATNVCGGATNTSSTVVGAFTVREPKNHPPAPKPATQQLFAGKIGTNQFTLDATGTTDPDIGQICNGSPASAPTVCGDTLLYIWTGPTGMNAAGSKPDDVPAAYRGTVSSVTGCSLGTTCTNFYAQVVAPGTNGTLGVPAQVTGSFPLGISTVNLTVFDQAGASATAQVSVTVNSFTLSTTNQSAVISAGQSTSFQVVPQDANKQPLQFTGNMTLTCTGKKDSDGSSLAANHVTCTVSPNPISQSQFATALITTTGPNFSQVRPVTPGNGGGRSLALIFALMSPALMGIVLVPGKSRRWKGLLLVVLVLACIGVQLGCGGSGNAPAAQSIPATTPSGTYTITISGTSGSGATSTNTFTLTVQ